MGKRVAVSNDASVLDGEKPEGFKFNFGDGLYAKVTNKVKYYEVRLWLDGQDTSRRIGKCSDISIEKARSVANRWREEWAKEREVIRSADRKQKLKDRRAMRGKAISWILSDKASLWLFIRRLLGADKLIPYEFRTAIWLQLLMPTKPRELWRARRDLPIVTNRRLFLGKAERGGSTKAPAADQYVLVSDAAEWVIRDYINGHICDKGKEEWLFPSLATLNNSEQDELISSMLNRAWSECPVGPTNITDIFYAVVCRYGQFRSEFIREIANRAYSNKVAQPGLYLRQALFILDWWGEWLAGLSAMRDFVDGVDSSVTGMGSPWRQNRYLLADRNSISSESVVLGNREPTATTQGIQSYSSTTISNCTGSPGSHETVEPVSPLINEMSDEEREKMLKDAKIEIGELAQAKLAGR